MAPVNRRTLSSFVDVLELTREPGVVHLKDARRDVIDGITADGASVEAIWRRRVFCRLGEVNVNGALDQLKEIGYSGWLVVEQDTMPDPAWPLERAAADQVANRSFLKQRGI